MEMKRIKVVRKCNIIVMERAIEMAEMVGFLDSSYFGRYVSALHDAILWGKYIDCKNEGLKAK